MNLDHILDIDEGSLVSGRAEMAAAFAKAKASGKPIALHFHGGLVSRKSALEDAPARQAFYLAAGAYPLLPIWKTGPFEVLPDILPRLAKEALFKILVDRVTGFVHAQMKDLLSAGGARSVTVHRSLGEVTETEMDKSALGPGDFTTDFLKLDPAKTRGREDLELSVFQEKSIEGAVRADVELNLTVDAVLLGADLPVSEGARALDMMPKADVPLPSVADRSALEELRADSNRRGLGLGTAVKVVMLVAKVIKRFIDGSDHGLHATVVEEVLRKFYGSAIGTAAWSKMKEYTVKAFDPQTPHAAGVALIEELNKVVPEQRVMLIGHSAGSIFILQLLKHFDGIPKRFEVVFLAPAATVSLFKEGLVDRPHQLAKFRMYTMNDEFESQDTLVRDVPLLGDLTWFYPRSLLYLVSGIMEEDANSDSLIDEALVGMQRSYLPGYRNAHLPHIEAARTFFGKDVVWAVQDNADPRLRSNSTSHGGFGHVTSDNTSMASVAALLRQGW